MLEDTQLKQSTRLTTDAYEKAVKIVGYNNVDIKFKYINEEISRSEYQTLFEALDEVYRDIICKLPTYVLQNIITAKISGQQRRAQKTIDTIAIELFQRELERSEKKGTT